MFNVLSSGIICFCVFYCFISFFVKNKQSVTMLNTRNFCVFCFNRHFEDDNDVFMSCGLCGCKEY